MGRMNVVYLLKEQGARSGRRGVVSGPHVEFFVCLLQQECCDEQDSDCFSSQSLRAENVASTLFKGARSAFVLSWFRSASAASLYFV